MPIFIHPQAPLRLSSDHFLYNMLVDGMIGWGTPLWVYSILSFFIMYLQASFINRISNIQKIFPKANFLPAMAFLLITSFFKEWNLFSSVMLVNALLIWIFYRLLLLYNNPHARGLIYNLGILMGLISLLQERAALLILLLLSALAVMRAFRLREWILAILGWFTPYYFLAFYFFMTDQWQLSSFFPDMRLALPILPHDWLSLSSILLVMLPFLIGAYYIQENMNKMLIQVRKNWSLLLIFGIIGFVIALATQGPVHQIWLMSAVPLAMFHAAAYYFPSSRQFARFLHWICFGFCIYLNYIV